MFGTSGIRGPVGEEVTAALSLSVGRALGVETERVVVGRDARTSGGPLLDALAAGLRESGTAVVDLGVAATPTVARAVSWREADAGVSVTASHNPPADNGLKLWLPSGRAYDDAAQERIASRVRSESFDLVPWDRIGDRRAWDATDRHVEAAVAGLAVPDSPRVVLDVGNGAGGLASEALADLGCHLETLNAQPDGAFPGRPSEPTADHCRSLSTLVGAGDADLGLALDGDGDRCLAVTADGTFIGGDALLAVFAREAAAPGETVAVPVDTSLAVADVLAEDDVAVTYTPVGDVSVAEAATRPGVAFGGEPSGAWIWPDETLCPDGLRAACRLVALDTERPLGERIGDVPSYPIRRESVPVEDKEAVMDKLRSAVLSRYEDVRTLDGVRAELGDAWFLVRASGTQPLVRVTAEARTAARAADAFERARAVLAAVGVTDLPRE